MEFEWNPAKERINIAKHGLDFTQASRVLQSDRLDRVDEREDYGEVRTISVGLLDGVVVVVVVHTDRGGRTRIISARRAGRRERRLYEAAVRKGPDG